jgi:hypothetical protein
MVYCYDEYLCRFKLCELGLLDSCRESLRSEDSIWVWEEVREEAQK